MNNLGLNKLLNKSKLRLNSSRLATAIILCFVIIGFILAILPLLKSSASAYVKDECPWADPPTIWGHIYLDDMPLDGANVSIFNQTKSVIYRPYAPDLTCEMKIPETQSHPCCYHGDGSWESYWEWMIIDTKRPLSRGDVIIASATWNGQTLMVNAVYNGRGSFQMPDIRFLSAERSA
jgi:hypothetical protein